jgi:hypothetical protein
VRDYLTAFHLAAVFVAAPKAETPIGLGAGRAVPGPISGWRRAGGPPRRPTRWVNVVLGCDLRNAPRTGDLLCRAGERGERQGAVLIPRPLSPICAVQCPNFRVAGLGPKTGPGALLLWRLPGSPTPESLGPGVIYLH